jgi:aspartyl/asparaginyl beta-hydroxylase (cupin superfamily)
VEQIWYYERGEAYPENEPKYYDSKAFPQLAAIEEKWPKIKQELRNFIEEKDKAFRANNYQGVNVEGGWSSLGFIFWGSILSTEFYKKCSITSGYLKGVDGLVSLSLSRLSAHSTIARHRGDTNAIMRCHLGIDIPAGLPQCGLKVGEEEKGWQEGKWTLFNDAYIHSAWNNTDKGRVVLILDTVRPEFLKKKNRICSRVITYHIINNKLGRKKPFKESSFFIKTIICGIVFLILYLYRPLQNFIKGI